MGTPIVGQHVLFHLPDYHRDAGRMVIAQLSAVHNPTCVSLETLHPQESFTSVVLGMGGGQWSNLPEDAVHGALRAENAKLTGDLAALQTKAAALEAENAKLNLAATTAAPVQPAQTAAVPPANTVHAGDASPATESAPPNQA